MAQVVHLSLLITHEVIGELVVPGIVITLLNTLFFGDWRQLEEIGNGEETHTDEDPFEEPNDLNEHEDSHLIPAAMRSMLPSVKAGLAEVNVVEERCLSKGKLAGAKNLSIIMGSLLLKQGHQTIVQEDCEMSPLEHVEDEFLLRVFLFWRQLYWCVVCWTMSTQGNESIPFGLETVFSFLLDMA